QTRGTRGAGKKAGGYLLSGLVRCASCGYVMVSNTNGGARHRTYRCRTNAQGAVGCAAPAWASAVQLEQWVRDQLAEDFDNTDFDPVATDADVVGADADLAAAKTRLARLVRRFGDLGDLGD